MKKIGLLINRISSGLSEMYFQNKYGWESFIRDSRSDLDPIELSSIGSNTLSFIFFNELGAYICIIKIIPGRLGDHVAAWIFVPKNIVVTGDELESIVTSISIEISKIAIDKVYLDKLFSKEYDTRNIYPVYKESDKIGFAFRYYGSDYSLKEILNSLYQDYYTNYKAVYLIDKTSGVICNGSDLTNTKLQKWFTLSPCEPNKDGFVPYYNGKPFNSPILVNESSRVTIIWKKSRYKDIESQFTVDTDMPIQSVNEKDYYKIVSKNDFRIESESGSKINIYELSINNTPIKSEGSLIHETSLSNATAIVSAEGYVKYENVHNLLFVPIVIRLKKEKFIHIFRLPSENNNKYYSIRQESNYQFEKSPIAGYRENSPKKNGNEYTYDLTFDKNLYSVESHSQIKKKTKLSSKLLFAPIWFWFTVILCIGFVIGGSLSEYLHKKNRQEKIVVTPSKDFEEDKQKDGKRTDKEGMASESEKNNLEQEDKTGEKGSPVTSDEKVGKNRTEKKGQDAKSTPNPTTVIEDKKKVASIPTTTPVASKPKQSDPKNY